MLSQHLCSRWYRPPEFILMSEFYDSQVDIWSLGCIVYEVAYMFDTEGRDS